MPTFCKAFEIKKTQAEVDFVDVSLHTDNRLFLDPFALSQRLDRWSNECHQTLVAFFQLVIDDIRAGRGERARRLFLNLREPNETRLGFSARRPQGAGIGNLQADQLYEALRDSAAVGTGFLSSLEECELLIDGIGRDKISDLTTNIIRGHLIEYTASQCDLHGVARQQVPLPPSFDRNRMAWVAHYAELPVWRNRRILLVPKAIVRYDPAYQHQQYYRQFVLEYLQTEHLQAGSSLVRTLANGNQRVYKTDLQAEYPCTKNFLYQFSHEHPEVLQGYKDALARLERQDQNSEVDPEQESDIAGILAQALRAINPGSEHATEYHRLMVGVVEFLFFPKLLYPVKEAEIHEGRKRIDIRMANGAHTGVFYDLPNVRRIPCPYIFFECKNYRTEVANPELDQLTGRFSTNRGNVGFLCCRRFQDRGLFVQRCRDVFGDGRGLILPFEDNIVLRLLGHIEAGHRNHLEEELTRLIAEVSAN